MTIFNQSFESSDLMTVFMLILLEALLSADNALVLATLASQLDKKEQSKALTYGIVGAWVLRLIAILFASTIMKFWWLQALGAAYLLFLPFKHFYSRKVNSNIIKKKPLKKKSFWRIVLEIELIDVAFAIDSVLAGVAMISGNDKIWVVYLGAILGIVLLRLVAGRLIGVIEKYPGMDHLAYVLVGWIGLKLAFSAGEMWSRNLSHINILEMSHTIFWAGSLILISIGISMIKFNYDKKECG